jgi:hypothetical protein
VVSAVAAVVRSYGSAARVLMLPRAGVAAVCGVRLGTLPSCVPAGTVDLTSRDGWYPKRAVTRDQRGPASVRVPVSCAVTLWLSLMATAVVAVQAGETALLCACAKGHIDVARWLVKEAGCDVRSERDNVRCKHAVESCLDTLLLNGLGGAAAASCTRASERLCHSRTRMGSGASHAG